MAAPSATVNPHARILPARRDMGVLLLHGRSPGGLGRNPKICAAADPRSIGGQADLVAVAVNKQAARAPLCKQRVGGAASVFATILRRIDRLRGPPVAAA